MSRIAPDIPELSQVPDVLRGVVWTRATMCAIRAPLTLALTAIAAVMFCAAGAWLVAWAGGVGLAAAGVVLGLVAAAWLYLRVLVHWQARRLLPHVLASDDWRAGLREAVRADERLKAIVASSRHRDPRPPRS